MDVDIWVDGHKLAAYDILHLNESDDAFGDDGSCEAWDVDTDQENTTSYGERSNNSRVRPASFDASPFKQNFFLHRCGKK